MGKEVVWLFARVWDNQEGRYKVNAWVIRDGEDVLLYSKTIGQVMQDYITKGHEFEILEICKETEQDYLRGHWGCPSDERYEYWCGVFGEGFGG